MGDEPTLKERVRVIEDRLGIDHAAIAADKDETHQRGVEQNAPGVEAQRLAEEAEAEAAAEAEKTA